ncbi:MAG TPA: hypothetical protein VIV55_10055 [Flavobacterium sp.]
MKKLTVIALLAFGIGFGTIANAQKTIFADSVNDGTLINIDTHEVLATNINSKLKIDFINNKVILFYNNKETIYKIDENVVVPENNKKCLEPIMFVKCSNGEDKLTIVYDYTKEPIGIMFSPEDKYVLYVFPIQ